MFGQENRTLEILDPNIPIAFSRGRILYAYQRESLERGKGSAVNVEIPLRSASRSQPISWPGTMAFPHFTQVSGSFAVKLLILRKVTTFSQPNQTRSGLVCSS